MNTSESERMINRRIAASIYKGCMSAGYVERKIVLSSESPKDTMLVKELKDGEIQLLFKPDKIHISLTGGESSDFKFIEPEVRMETSGVICKKILNSSLSKKHIVISKISEEKKKLLSSIAPNIIFSNTEEYVTTRIYDGMKLICE